MTRPVGDRKEAAALILFFLSHVEDARIERIVRFMGAAPLSFAPGTTRNTLSLLKRRGLVEKSGYGRYRIAPARASLITRAD